MTSIKNINSQNLPGAMLRHQITHCLDQRSPVDSAPNELKVVCAPGTQPPAYSLHNWLSKHSSPKSAGCVWTKSQDCVEFNTPAHPQRQFNVHPQLFSQNAALGLREAGILSKSAEGQGRQNVGASDHRREVCSCHQEQEGDSFNTNQTSTTHTHT